MKIGSHAIIAKSNSFLIKFNAKQRRFFHIMGFLAFVFAVVGAALNFTQSVVTESGVTYTIYSAFMLIFNNIKENGFPTDPQAIGAIVVFAVLCLIPVWAVFAGLCALIRKGRPAGKLFFCALFYGLIAGGLYWLATTSEIPQSVNDFLALPFMKKYIMPYAKGTISYMIPAIWAGCYLLASMSAAVIRKPSTTEQVQNDVRSNANNNFSRQAVSTKSQSFNLSRNNPGLSKIIVGLGWDVNTSGAAFDLNTSAFMLGSNGRVLNDIDFVFYNNVEHQSGAVKYISTKEIDRNYSDSEQMKIDLSRIPADVQKIVFSISIHEAEENNQDFGSVFNLFVRVLDERNNNELVRYELENKFAGYTALIVAELVRNNGNWNFNVVGDGMNGGLMSVCKKFGVNV